MAKADTYADILRALGRFLDEKHAHEVEIVEQSTFMATSWRTPDGAQESNRTYNELGMQTLRERARRLRGGEDGPAPTGNLSELLRTLGQELDAMDFDLTRIQEDEDGFTVSGAADKIYQALYIRKFDLLAEATGRRAMRKVDHVPPSRNATGSRGWRFWQKS